MCPSWVCVLPQYTTTCSLLHLALCINRLSRSINKSSFRWWIGSFTVYLAKMPQAPQCYWLCLSEECNLSESSSQFPFILITIWVDKLRAHCLKITQKVSFYNIASEASYVYLRSKKKKLRVKWTNAILAIIQIRHFWWFATTVQKLL